MQRTADLSRLPRDTGERRDLTVGRDFAARNFCDDGIDAGVRRHFFSFLPSFLFFLCGAPLVEATHGNRKFTAPLTGITAAAVGFVVLAAFFAWPDVTVPLQISVELPILRTRMLELLSAAVPCLLMSRP